MSKHTPGEWTVDGLIAELCPCGRADGYECEQHSFDLLTRVRELKARAEKAEAELAKRDLLLEQSPDYHDELATKRQLWNDATAAALAAARFAPEYAEWLKARQ